MKNLKSILITFIITISILSTCIEAQDSDAAHSSSNNTASMIVRLTDFSSSEGRVMVALYDSKNVYEESKAYKAFASEITNKKVEYVFEGIPFGEYAIKCYHDENSNGKMDTNFMGIPSEAYGFSNNARGSFGPADYDDAKFNFQTNGQIVEISLD